MATAIDEFFISIGIDPQKAEKGLQKLDSSISGGLGKLNKATGSTSSQMATNFQKGLQQTEGFFQQAGNNIMGMIKNFIAPITAIFGFSKMFSEYTAQADAIGKMSRELGVNGEQLQMWGEAAKRAGGTAEGFQGSLKSLKTNLAQFKFTGQSSLRVPLARMGIDLSSLGGDPFKVMRSLAGKMQGMSQQRAMRIGQTLGFDAGTIALLQKGTKEVDALIARQKELGVYTKKDMEIAEKWRNALYDLQQVFRSISAIIMRVVVPPLKFIADQLTEGIMFLRRHEPFLMALITGIAAAITIKLLPAIAGAITAMAPIAAAMAPIAAAISAAALIFDDFWVYVQGGESALSGLWAQFGTGEEIMKNLRAAWEGVKATLTTIMDAIKNGISYIFDALKPLATTFAPIGDAIKSIYTAFKELFDVVNSIFAPITDLAASFLSLFTSADPSGTTEKMSLLKAAVTIIAETISNVAGAIKLAFDGVAWVLDKIKTGVDWLKTVDFSSLFDFSLPDFSHLFDSLTFPNITEFFNLDPASIESLKKTMLVPFEALLSLFDKIKNFSITETLSNWGTSIKNWWQGIIDYIKNLWNNFVSDLANLVPDWLKKPLGIKTDEDKQREKSVSEAVGGKTEQQFVQEKVKNYQKAGVASGYELSLVANDAAKEYRTKTEEAGKTFDQQTTQKKIDDINAQVETNKQAAALDDMWAAFAPMGTPEEAVAPSTVNKNTTAPQNVNQDTQVNINQVNVQTQATDAQGVANGFVQGVNDATTRNGLVIAANSGVRR